MSVSPSGGSEYLPPIVREVDARTGLPILSPAEQAVHDEWYDAICQAAPEGLKPAQITAENQPAFASFLNKFLHDNQVQDRQDKYSGASPPLPLQLVDNSLRAYYSQFPPSANDSSQRELRIAYQTRQLPVLRYMRARSDEVKNTYIIRRALRDHEHQQATAAVFALQTAYATLELLRGHPQTRPDNMTRIIPKIVDKK